MFTNEAYFEKSFRRPFAMPVIHLAAKITTFTLASLFTSCFILNQLK